MSNDRRFTMGFREAMEHNIDYRDYTKVRELPTGVKLTAIAGVWGDYCDLRCLFETEDGERICRTVFNRLTYWIPELDIYGKEIEPLQVFIV